MELGRRIRTEVLSQVHNAPVDGRHMRLIEDKTDTGAQHDQLAKYRGGWWSTVIRCSATSMTTTCNRSTARPGITRCRIVNTRRNGATGCSTGTTCAESWRSTGAGTNAVAAHVCCFDRPDAGGESGGLERLQSERVLSLRTFCVPR